MPENYQAIFDSLGGTTEDTNLPKDQTGDEVTQSDEPEATAEPEATDAATEATPTAEDAANQAVENNRANEAFAAMRSENSKYKKFMQQVMKGAGFNGTEDEFIEQLTNASYEQQAKRQGNQVSPELLRRMDSLETQNKNLIESQNRQTFIANLQKMQTTLGLKESDVKEFVDYAIKEHLDLTVPGINFTTLYQGIFFDKLMNKKIEDARQTWIAQSSKASNAASPDGKSGKKDPSPTNVNTMAEFEGLLQNFSNNTK